MKGQALTPLCPYCGQFSHLATGQEIYPHRPDLFAKQFYCCTPCDAYVGCHPGTMSPLGQLANAKLRKQRRTAHAAFDPLWEQEGFSRTEAYTMLAEAIDIPKQFCHIGWFDEVLCQRVIDLCNSGEIFRFHKEKKHGHRKNSLQDGSAE